MSEAANGQTPTKREAVRLGLEELGPDAKPVELRRFAKERFDLDITADLASTYKGEFRKAAKSAKKPAKAAPKAPAAPAKAAVPAPGDGVTIDDIRTVKELLARVGAGQMRDLIDLLAD